MQVTSSNQAHRGFLPRLPAFFKVHPYQHFTASSHLRKVSQWARDFLTTHNPSSRQSLMMIVAKWDEGCPCGPLCRSGYLAGMSGMKAGIELNKDVDILLLLRVVTSPLRDHTSRLGVQQLPKTLGCFGDLLGCNKKSSEARRFNNPHPKSFDVNMRWDFPGWVSSMLTLLFTHY
jgi:hypothetical protein